jgi:hypothetical protein
LFDANCELDDGFWPRVQRMALERDGRRPHFRGVQVALGTGYHLVRGSGRSRNGRVSASPDPHKSPQITTNHPTTLLQRRGVRWHASAVEVGWGGPGVPLPGGTGTPKSQSRGSRRPPSASRASSPHSPAPPPAARTTPASTPPHPNPPHQSRGFRVCFHRQLGPLA